MGANGAVCAELNLERYKFVVQVVIGEQRGEGVRMGARCFWDDNTDGYAQEVFQNVRRPRPLRPCPAPPLPPAATHQLTTPLPLCAQDQLFCVAAAFGIYFY